MASMAHGEVASLSSGHLLILATRALSDAHRFAVAKGKTLDSLCEDEFELLVNDIMATSDYSKFSKELLIMLKLDRQSGRNDNISSHAHLEMTPANNLRESLIQPSKPASSYGQKLQQGDSYWHIQPVNGGTYRGSGRLFFDTKAYPGFNFVGRLLGHGGHTIRKLEAQTECRMQIRGRGSVRDPAEEARQRAAPGHEHLNEDLHIIFEAEGNSEQETERKLNNCREFLLPYLVPTSTESLALKAEQELLAPQQGKPRPLENKAIRMKQNGALPLLGHYEHGQLQYVQQPRPVQVGWPCQVNQSTASTNVMQVQQARPDIRSGLVTSNIVLQQQSQLQCWQTEDVIQQGRHNFLSNTTLPTSTIALLPTPASLPPVMQPATYTLDQQPPPVNISTCSPPYVVSNAFTPTLRDSANLTDGLAFCADRPQQPVFDATPGAGRNQRSSNSWCTDKENCLIKSGLPGWSPEGEIGALRRRHQCTMFRLSPY